MNRPDFKSILVIRRDNIGDLVCTTPLIAALREAWPDAWLGALVNDYTRPVLDNNPDLDAVFSYQKAKHRAPGQSLLGVYWRRLQMLWHLRRRRIDCVVLASPGYQASAERLARMVRARHVVGSAHGTNVAAQRAPGGARAPLHQVEQSFRLLRALGIAGEPPPLKLVPDARKRADYKATLAGRRSPVVGVHISAREADRRWPDARFAELIKVLIDTQGATVVLTWAPGARDKPEFPGDDDSAQSLIANSPKEGLLPLQTRTLSELIASLAVCDVVICSDGGPVHLAAALGKPVVCLFGSEKPELWHPWRVPYRLLQPASRRVSDIGVDEVLGAYAELIAGR